MRQYFSHVHPCQITQPPFLCGVFLHDPSIGVVELDLRIYASWLPGQNGKSGMDSQKLLAASGIAPWVLIRPMKYQEAISSYLKNQWNKILYANAEQARHVRWMMPENSESLTPFPPFCIDTCVWSFRGV